MIPENKQLAVTKALQKAFDADAFEGIQQLTKGLSGSQVFKNCCRWNALLITDHH